MSNPSTKFEINLIGGTNSDLTTGILFAHKNNCPAVVVPQQLIPNAIIERQRMRSGFKIILAVDFENKGRNYAINKFRDLSQDAFAVDGYDILLTPDKTMIELGNEMKALKEFLRNINSLTEIRWTINSQWDKKYIETVAKLAGKEPGNFIRTDINISNNISVDKHVKNVKLISKHCPTPVKVSGGIDFDAFKKLDNRVARFDISASQGHNIKHAFTRETAKAKEV